MIKVSKATMATIKRFPELYKRQAMQVIDKECRDAINITALLRDGIITGSDRAFRLRHERRKHARV